MLKSLENWVKATVVERWEMENSDYMAKAGFDRDILQHPERIPAVQAGDYHGSAISYDKDFPSKIITLILSATSDKTSTGEYINQIFTKIQRRGDPVADGDHHSITYGEPVFTQWVIDTKDALLFAENIKRTADDSGLSEMTDHHGRQVS